MIEIINNSKDILKELKSKYCPTKNLNNTDNNNSDNLFDFTDYFDNTSNSSKENICSDEETINEVYIPDNFNFDKLKNSLLYFINIISKENISFNNDKINKISENIEKLLNINHNNLFIIQNSSINNFIKSLNFEDISLDKIQLQPIISKFEELKLLQNELLIKEYQIGKDLFDNRWNCLNPNSGQNIYRGKEKYELPYNWIGIGLDVLGKYENDIWLNDISDKSKWAIAYRGIGTNISSNNVKKYLKYFVEKDLNIAISKSKSESNDKRHWKKVNDGIYLTPYIHIAEKCTQSIIFNNKIYKVLLII